MIGQPEESASRAVRQRRCRYQLVRDALSFVSLEGIADQTTFLNASAGGMRAALITGSSALAMPTSVAIATA